MLGHSLRQAELRTRRTSAWRRNAEARAARGKADRFPLRFHGIPAVRSRSGRSCFNDAHVETLCRHAVTRRRRAFPVFANGWDQADAFEHFAGIRGADPKPNSTIKPHHWYVSCRLVLEGGFHPDELKPRPPFTVTKRDGQHLVGFDQTTATGGEATGSWGG